MKPLIMVSLFFILTCCAQNTIEKPSFAPNFEVSQKTTHEISKKQEYTFGYLEVLENRQDAKSQTIKIPVYIFKSRNPNPQKDPIIYTVGGPGATTMPSAQYMDYYSYLDDRDFILLEQRGNYYAKPHLDCPEWSEAMYQSNLPDFNSNENDTLFAKAALACKERLEKKGIDLDGYNTNEIAADINDLVTVLGIPEYNLLTVSYSTKIAQVLLRDYPERIRSVVMDSPLPLAVNYDEESVKNLLEALDTILSDCTLDVDCNQAYPNIKKRFFDYLEDKTNDPLIVEVKNPNSAKLETFYLKGEDLISFFSNAPTGDVKNIPYEINKLLNHDLSALKEQLAYLFKGPGNGAGIGMRLSVWCAEEYPFVSQEIVTYETTKYPQTKGLSPEVFTSEICEIWGVQMVSEIENQAIKSEVPVLLISGEYDEITPVKWASSMKKNLTNSHHLIFKGWKHTPTTNWGNQCAMNVANSFFQYPGKEPKLNCQSKINATIFKTK